MTSIADAVDPANNATYSYDANGNLIASDEGGVQRSLVYDQRDRLVRVTEDSTPVMSARYDWRGRRVEKDGAVGMRKYLWDGDHLLSEHDESGATLTTHYHPDSQPRATPLASFNTAAGWSFLHEDGLGSVIASTALSASVAERTAYDAWGQVTSQSGFAAHDFGFTAHLRDQETDTLYARARDYDPTTGRFLTRDPFAGRLTDPPTQHPYLYARANPATYVDPLRLDAEEFHWSNERAIPSGTSYFAAETPAGETIYFQADPDAWPQDAWQQTGWSYNLVKAFAVGDVTTKESTLVGRVADYLFSGLADAYEALVGESEELSQRVDAAQRRPQRDVEELATLLAQRSDARLENLQEVTRSVGRVVEASGEVALEGVVTADKVALGAFAGKVAKGLASRAIRSVPRRTARYAYDANAGRFRDLSTAAPVPTFGATGGAKQYLFNSSIQDLVDRGFLEVVR